MKIIFSFLKREEKLKYSGKKSFESYTESPNTQTLPVSVNIKICQNIMPTKIGKILQKSHHIFE